MIDLTKRLSRPFDVQQRGGAWLSDRILYQKLRLLSFAASLKPPRRQEATVRCATRRLPVNFKASIRRLTIGALIAIIIAAGTNLFSYWNADKLVLSMHDAQEVDEHSAPELVAIVRELAQRAGLPMPRVYLMDSPQPNAFATGRNPQHAAVCATTGLLNTLSRDEIAGVIGHELGHVRNHDTLTMTITATIAGAISMLAQFGMFFRGGNRDNSGLGIVGSVLMLILVDQI